MASTSSQGINGAKTRLKDATEKRRAEMESKEKEEMKRQKKMFAPSKEIGPRDIFMNTNLPKIKLENDVECNSTVKQDDLDTTSPSIELHNDFVNSNLLEIKPEVEESTVVKVEETLDLASTIGQSSEIDEPIEQHNNIANEVDVDHKLFSSGAEQNDNLPEVAPESGNNNVTTNPTKIVEEKEQEISVLTKLINRLQIRLVSLAFTSVKQRTLRELE